MDRKQGFIMILIIRKQLSILMLTLEVQPTQDIL